MPLTAPPLTTAEAEPAETPTPAVVLYTHVLDAGFEQSSNQVGPYFVFMLQLFHLNTLLSSLSRPGYA